MRISKLVKLISFNVPFKKFIYKLHTTFKNIQNETMYVCASILSLPMLRKLCEKVGH